MPTIKSIIVLQNGGAGDEPYIAKDMDGKNKKDLQKVCFGFIEQVNNNNWDISSMCVNSSPKWKWVYLFLKSLRINQYKLFVNDIGREVFCPNMALIYKTQDFSSLHGKMCSKEDIENCPHIVEHLFGRCALVVNKSYITDFNNNFNHNEAFCDSMLQTKVINYQLEEESSEEEEDPYADEKAYDEYKGK